MRGHVGWTLSQRPLLRLGTLCALYVAQGIPYGFVTVTLVAYLVGQGAGIDAVASVTAVAALPWAFKWVWGPVLDRFGYPAMGRRRPWILLAQSMMALTIAAMIAIPELHTSIRLLGWMVLLHNVFAALQDVAVDALAVDLLKEKERGRANGFMYASSYLGALLGGAGMGWFLARFDMRSALLFQVGILFAIMLAPLLARERPGEKRLPWSAGRAMAPPSARQATSMWGLFQLLWRSFTLRASLLTALLALLSYIGQSVLYTVSSVYFVQTLKWSQAEFSNIMGGLGVVAGMSGSVLGGLLADWFGSKRMIALSSVALGLCWVVFSFCEPLWPLKGRFMTPFVLTEAFLLGVFAVSFFSLAMGVSWPRVAATQFTAYMAFMNLSRAFGAKLAEPLSRVLDFDHLYLVMGLFQMALAALLLFIDPGQTRRTLGDVTDDAPST